MQTQPLQPREGIGAKESNGGKPIFKLKIIRLILNFIYYQSLNSNIWLDRIYIIMYG